MGPKKKFDKFEAALNLPIVATDNLRSLRPKFQSLKNDLFERSVGIGFLQKRGSNQKMTSTNLKFKSCWKLMALNTFLPLDLRIG